MVKSVLSMICVFFILLFFGIYENIFITKNFSELNDVFTALYEKTENESANKEDVLSTQKNWHNKKKYLHAFIPHTEIKEIDLWLSEAVTFVDEKDYKEALSKLEVLIELTEQIPKTFAISFENIL